MQDQLLSSHGVLKRQPVRVQRLSTHFSHQRPTVKRISHQRMPYGSHVDANLMGAPRVQGAFDPTP